MAEAAAALDLSVFAYLAFSEGHGDVPKLITTYPSKWTDHYLQNRYERLDPVIRRVCASAEPFVWGFGMEITARSPTERQLFEEAANFGIRWGFTVPIHDARGLIAAMTFAADERRQQFEKCISEHRRVLQLMAIYFHAHARRLHIAPRAIDGILLSSREFECLEWAAHGKSAWEIGCILGISHHTVAFHLENAKAKLGVRTIVQAVARLATSAR
jgi:LuxR family transcriptional activator of conjugal transfer of Ti plasmids